MKRFWWSRLIMIFWLPLSVAGLIILKAIDLVVFIPYWVATGKDTNFRRWSDALAKPYNLADSKLERKFSEQEYQREKLRWNKVA